MWQKDPNLLAKVIQDKYGFKRTYKDIRDRLKSEDGVETSIRQIREAIGNMGLPQRESDYYNNLDAERVAKYFNGLLQLPEFKIKVPKKKKKSHREKVILISDLHLPFVNKKLLAELVTKEKGAHQLHINGDIFDFYSLSRFIPYRMNLTFVQEFNDAMQYLKIIAETWPTIEFSIGNHFTRLFKHLISKLGNKDMFETGILQYKPEQIITSNFPNMIKAEHRIVGTDLNVCFLNIIGKDFLYGHFEKSSKIVGKAVKDSYDTMRAWKKAFEFSMDDIKVCAQAHTHKMFMSPYEFNSVILLETGCMCDIQDYTMQPSMNYSPPNPGYISFISEDGNTDWDTIKFHIYKG